MDLLEFLRSLQPAPYDDNLPQGAPRRRFMGGSTEAAARAAAQVPGGERLAFPKRPSGALDDPFSGDSNMDPLPVSPWPKRVGVTPAGPRDDFSGASNMQLDEPAPMARNEDTELRGRAMGEIADRRAAEEAVPARGALEPKTIPGQPQWSEFNPDNQDEADAVNEVKDASERGQLKSVKVMNPGALAETGDSQVPSAPGALEGGGPAQAPARASLAEAFRKRVSETEAKIGRDLTDDEKGQLQMDFFLRLMSSSSKPGGTLISNAGEAGLGTQAHYRQIQEEKRRSRREGRDDAYREVTLEDKDQDNQRLDKREAREGRRDEERLRLAREQLQQGKYDIKVGGRGGNFVLIDKKTGAVTDTGIKAADSVNTTRPAALQLLDHIKEHPEDADQLLKLTGKDGEQKEEAKLLDIATKIKAGDMSGKMTPQQAMREARAMLDEARGQSTAAPKPASQAEAHKQARDAISKGKDKNAVNQRLREWGYEPIK